VAAKLSDIKRLLLLGYLLLWVPSVLLMLRKSQQPEILGWWSHRSFFLVVLDVLLLLAATVFLCRMWKQKSELVGRIEQALRAVRLRRFALWMVAWAPPLCLLAILVYLAWISVPMTLPVLISLAATVLLVCVWEIVLILPGRPQAEQRDLLKKLALLGFSLLVSLLAVEASGWILQWHRFALWDINPKSTNVRFRTDSFDVRVVTNRQGLREPHTIPLEADNGSRIVVVGDSMTFGWGVDYDDTYPHVAERVLREKHGLADVQIVNMGRGGANLRDYLTFVRRYAVQFTPRIIVVGFLVGNDCPIVPPAKTRSDEELESTLREHIAASHPSPGEQIIGGSCVASLIYTGAYRRLGSLSSVASEGCRGPVYGESNPLAPPFLARDIDGAPDPEKSRAILHHLRNKGWIDKGLAWEVSPWLLRAAMLHPKGPADSLVTRAETAEAMRQEWTLCEHVLREIRQVAAAADAKLVILAIPPSHAVSRRWVDFLSGLRCEVNEDMTSIRTINDWLAEFAAGEKIPCIDPLDQLRAASESGTRLYFATDDHMTPLGHRLLGETLAEGLYRHRTALKGTGSSGG